LGYTHSSEKYKSVTLWKIDTYGVKSSFIYRFPLSQKSRENMEFRLTVFGSTFRKAKVDGKRVKFDDRQNLSSVNFTLRVSFGK
ncbi:MAG: hypothetical protein LUD68_10275, partial [Rikenellaceae bacterium]|nr:hypothetical protein [Rikenellaceae bacterium]